MRGVGGRTEVATESVVGVLRLVDVCARGTLGLSLDFAVSVLATDIVERREGSIGISTEGFV